jgi:hypothetical protein
MYLSVIDNSLAALQREWGTLVQPLKKSTAHEDEYSSAAWKLDRKLRQLLFLQYVFTQNPVKERD